MPRDYKNTRRPKAKSKPVRTPRWRGFFAGLLTGIAVTAGVFLAERFNLIEFTVAHTRTPTPHTNVASATSRAEPKPRFEFYTMLPEMEVAVEVEEIATKIVDDEPDQPKLLAGTYVLQVGSFRKHEEADALKASLALLGLEASIQTVSINGEETWHRVRLGPFTKREGLSDARRRLVENDIDAIVLKKRS